MDANAHACTVKPAKKSLGVVIRSAEWMGQGVKPTETLHAVHNEALSETAEQTISVETVLPLAANDQVWGLRPQLTEALKVNVLVKLVAESADAAYAAPDGAALHVDTLDLY